AMANALHMYPSWALLLWLWGSGVVLQVVVLLGWWAYCHERAIKQRRSHLYELIEQPQDAEARFPTKALDDGSTRSTRRHSTATLMPGKAAQIQSRPARSGADDDEDDASPAVTGTSHVFKWKMLALRSAVATVLIAVASIITTTIVLYLRTGAYTEQPYEWYALETTGARLFQSSMSLPTDILDTCKFRDAMATHTTLHTLDPVIEKFAAKQQKQSNPRTLVHVVPFDYDHVLELNLDQVTPILERLPNSWPLPDASRDLGNDLQAASAVTAAGFVKARPVDELTLFPYLWHSLLGPHFDSRVESSVAEPWTRSVTALNLDFRIVRTAEELRELPARSNLLVVAQALECINVMFEGDALPPEARVGFLTLSRENCNNPGPERFLKNTAIKFGLLPYGDCALVDGDRFASLPLGPSFEHGFPLNAHHLTPPPPLTGVGRKFLLNLMVSWTITKPTRVQAMMAALQVCGDLERETRANARRCVVEHNDMLFKALQAVDNRLGTAWRWYLSAAPAAYVSTLQQSVFTICPLGKNPEQYRIWEALAAGSIPIVEELPPQCQPPGVFYHPAYPDSWRCVPEDVHGVLRRLKAPVLFVGDWKRDLPRLMDRYFTRAKDGAKTNSTAEIDERDWIPTEELRALQARTRSWYVRLGHHLQAELVDKVMQQFGSIEEGRIKVERSRLPTDKTGHSSSSKPAKKATSMSWQSLENAVYMSSFLAAKAIPVVAVGSSIVFAISPCTLQFSFAPFFFYFVQSVIYTLYGYTTSNVVVGGTSLLGAVLGAFYVFVFYTNARDKTQATRMLTSATAAILLLTHQVATRSVEETQMLTGIPANILSVFTAASPLLQLKAILARKDASCLPFGMSAMTVVSGAIWTIYGLMLGDLLVICPNLFGLAMGAIQVALILAYPAGKAGAAGSAVEGKAKLSPPTKAKKKSPTGEKTQHLKA
ncbi:hypothetical protein BBJ28_00013256, partial [Nothophytophthora sp. Chile5]